MPASSTKHVHYRKAVPPMATDNFARFGIDHLSISSLRKFTEAPAAWVVTYLHGVKDDAGPARVRTRIRRG